MFPRRVVIASLCAVLASLHAAEPPQIPGLSLDAAKPTPALSVDEILQLRGKAYSDAVEAIAGYDERPKVSFDDLVRLLNGFHLEPATKKKGDEALEGILVWERAFFAACRAGGKSHLAELIDLFVHGPISNSNHGILLSPLAVPWIEQELDTIESEPLEEFALPESPAPLPARVQAMPEELQSAVRAYRAASTPFDTAFRLKEKEPWISFQENTDAFWIAANQILIGETKEALPRLRQFAWSGQCGTGLTMLTGPQDFLLFMGLLHERRLPEAIGGALMLDDSWPFGTSSAPRTFHIRRRLLQHCKLDWEAICVGGLIGDEEENAGVSPLISQMAAEGSPRGLHLLATSVPFLKDSAFDSAIGALVLTLGKPPGSREDFSIPGLSSIDPPPRQAPLPKEVQDEVVDTIAASINPESSNFSVHKALEPLTRFIRPSTTDALTRLLAHPEEEAADAAAEALRARGVTVPERRPVPPLHFAFRLGGRPLANCDLWFTLKTGESEVGESVKTDAKGGLEISPRSQARSGEPVTGYNFSLGYLVPQHSSLSDPWFSIYLAAPLQHAEVVSVVIPAQPLTILIAYPQAMPAYAGKELELTLKSLNEKQGFMDYRPPITFSVPVEPLLYLPTVQEGRYQIMLRVPGAATWKVEKVVVSNHPQTVEVKLTPGTDVHGRVRVGADARFGLAELWHDGHKVDEFPSYDEATEGFIYRGLPPGHYVLRVPSSSELRKKEPRDSQEIILKPKPTWAALERPFEITTSSPPEMNLDDLVLPLDTGAK